MKANEIKRGNKNNNVFAITNLMSGEFSQFLVKSSFKSWKNKLLDAKYFNLPLLMGRFN